MPPPLTRADAARSSSSSTKVTAPTSSGRRGRGWSAMPPAMTALARQTSTTSGQPAHQAVIRLVLPIAIPNSGASANRECMSR